uniref:Uncharacterized protein n=1 Tax=Mycobacterium leprae TaxID=1769 RepID=O33029_MYCLR|nr:hypothetical protein MLCB250.54c [Mycobacterium leprae]
MPSYRKRIHGPSSSSWMPWVLLNSSITACIQFTHHCKEWSITPSLSFRPSYPKSAGEVTQNSATASATSNVVYPGLCSKTIVVSSGARVGDSDYHCVGDPKIRCSALQNRHSFHPHGCILTAVDRIGSSALQNRHPVYPGGECGVNCRKIPSIASQLGYRDLWYLGHSLNWTTTIPT